MALLRACRLIIVAVCPVRLRGNNLGRGHQPSHLTFVQNSLQAVRPVIFEGDHLISFLKRAELKGKWTPDS